MDLWKNILALAILITPIAYCESESVKVRNQIQSDCQALRGEWNVFGHYCEFK